MRVYLKELKMAYLDCRTKGRYAKYMPPVPNGRYAKREEGHSPLKGQVIPYTAPVLPPHLAQALRAAFNGGANPTANSGAR